MPRLVFLSYNWDDRDAVRVIANGLTNRGVAVWFDEKDIASGEEFITKINDGLLRASSIVVFVGPLGLTNGVWQQKEIEAAVKVAVEQKKPLHVVRLPGLPADYSLPPVLATHNFFIFDQTASDAASLDGLAAAIKERDSTGLEENPGPSGFAPAARGWTEPEENVLNSFSTEARGLNFNFFVGPLSWKPTREIAGGAALGILKNADLLEPASSSAGVLPPMDVSAAYFTLRKQSPSAAAVQMDQVVLKNTREFPPEADTFAELLDKLSDLRRSSNRDQLVVTTNFDLIIERALLRAGVSFTRIVQVIREERVAVERYWRMEKNPAGCVYRKTGLGATAPSQEGKEFRFHRESVDGIDSVLKDDDVYCREWAYISAPPSDEGEPAKLISKLAFLGKAPQIILYKFCGSVDVPLSCLVSADDHCQCLKASRDLIPSKIHMLVEHNAAVLMGYHASDSDYRLLSYTVLESLPSGPKPMKFAFCPKPDSKYLSEFVAGRLDHQLQKAVERLGFVSIQGEIPEILRDLKSRLV